jgi:hypothetical protein
MKILITTFAYAPLADGCAVAAAVLVRGLGPFRDRRPRLFFRNSNRMRRRQIRACAVATVVLRPNREDVENGNQLAAKILND